VPDGQPFDPSPNGHPYNARWASSVDSPSLPLYRYRPFLRGPFPTSATQDSDLRTVRVTISPLLRGHQLRLLRVTLFFSLNLLYLPPPALNQLGRCLLPQFPFSVPSFPYPGSPSRLIADQFLTAVFPFCKPLLFETFEDPPSAGISPLSLLFLGDARNLRKNTSRYSLAPSLVSFFQINSSSVGRTTAQLSLLSSPERSFPSVSVQEPFLMRFPGAW